MIEIRYTKILFFQALFLFLLGTFVYNFFKRSFGIHDVSSQIWTAYLLIWFVFIFLNLLFIKFFALPTKALLKKLDSTTPPDDLSWSVIEDSLIKRDVHQQILQSEYEIENLKYKILLDALHDPVCIFGKDQIILYSNQAFHQLFSLSEASSKSTLLEVTRNLYFQDFVKVSIETNEVQRINEFSFSPAQDPLKKYFDIKIFPLKNISNYLCIMHDMTERKQADQMREDFVANFSHEVRTPLTIINGQIQTMKQIFEKNSEFEGQLRPLFDKVDNNSRRLINLFNDLLRLTSVEKKKDIFKEEIHIEPIIEGIVDELSHNYAQKSIKFHFSMKVTHFFVDYNLFEQVMINLIDNAYKYVGALGTVEINTYIQGQYNILEITDNGIGIPVEQQHRIFERFFRVDSSRSSEVAGTGLGLSIVKHIMQKHEGKIKVTSEPKKGTTFTLSFPIK